MKACTFVFAVLFSLFCSEIVSAFHGENALICAKCHTAHYAEDGSTPPGGDEGGPFEHLSVKESSSTLCLTCHDGKMGAPDVSGMNDANELDERAAGFFAPLDVDNPNGHNLSSERTGGNPSLSKVGCIDCHDPHGRDTNDPDYRYRNLQWASSPGSEPIIKAFVNPDASGLEIYEQNNIGYAAPVSQTSDWREVTNICFDCHRNFTGYSYIKKPPNENGAYIRHPSMDSERDIWSPIKHGPPQTDPVHWRNGTGIGFAIGRLPVVVSGAKDFATATAIATQTSKTTNEVFCLSCHKAHGSEYKDSLRWSANSNLGCQQCHNKG